MDDDGFEPTMITTMMDTVKLEMDTVKEMKRLKGTFCNFKPRT